MTETPADAIRRAINDPGTILPRYRDPDGTRESLTEWQTRAITECLQLPEFIIRMEGDDLTPEQVDQLKTRFREAQRTGRLHPVPESAFEPVAELIAQAVATERDRIASSIRQSLLDLADGYTCNCLDVAVFGHTCQLGEPIHPPWQLQPTSTPPPQPGDQLAQLNHEIRAAQTGAPRHRLRRPGRKPR